MSPTLEHTVQAWSQKELEIYSSLSLIPPLSELDSISNQIIACFAHRCFSGSVPNLIQQIHQPNRIYLCRLFQERTGIDLDTQNWLLQLRQWVDLQQQNLIQQKEYREFTAISQKLLSDLVCQWLNQKAERGTEDFESSIQDLYQFYACVPHCLRSHSNLSALDAVKFVYQRHIAQFETSVCIRSQLELIQSRLFKATTDIVIADLEKRTQTVGESLGTLSENQRNLLMDKYTLICDWINQVRLGFTEAEGILSWIKAKTEILKNRPSMAEILQALDVPLTPDQVSEWTREHEALERQVEAFDKQDVTRLRVRVKDLTGENHDLSPADTTMIEITFTAFVALDRLTHLLRQRSYELQVLTLRIRWEQEYKQAMAWVRLMLDGVSSFIDQKARWRPTADKSRMTETLVEFEQQCAEFDQGQYTTVVNIYQGLDDSVHMKLPAHLESKQVALKVALDTLTDCVALARQLVEQHLAVSGFLDRAVDLKTTGEYLQQELTWAQQNLSHSTELGKKVGAFKENVHLLTVATKIPYPDQADNDTNEAILDIMKTHTSILALLNNALDQALENYYRTLRFTKRAKELDDEIRRLVDWANERIRVVNKTKVNMLVGVLNELDLFRLQKEHDEQVFKLKGIRDDDFCQLGKNIATLCASFSPTSVDSLKSHLDELEKKLDLLNKALAIQCLGLDLLKKCIAWEMLYENSLQWIIRTIPTIWEFTAQKAQWRPSNSHPSPEWDKVKQEFGEIQLELETFKDHQLQLTTQGFEDLLKRFSLIEQDASFTVIPKHVKPRQEELNQRFSHLQALFLFSRAILDQHVSLDIFSITASTLHEQGDALLAHLQQCIANTSYTDQDKYSFEQAVDDFSCQVLDLWTRSGSVIPYPYCDKEARATRPCTTDDLINYNIENEVHRAYGELQDLVNRLRDLLSQWKSIQEHRKELERCIKETILLSETLNNVRKVYDLDCILYSDDTIQNFCQSLDSEKLKDLTGIDQHNPLMKRIEALEALDTAIDRSRLATVKDQHKALSEHAELFMKQARCYHVRLCWESLLSAGLGKIDSLWQIMSDEERKGEVCQDNHSERLQMALNNANKCNQELMTYINHDLVNLETAYTETVTSFGALDKIPLTVQGRQFDLKRRVGELQDAIHSRLVEVDRMQKRQEWQVRVAKVLEKCNEFEAKVKSFIQADIRYLPQHKDVKHEAHALRGIFEVHKAAIDELLDDADEPSILKTAMENLQRSVDSLNYMEKVNAFGLWMHLTSQNIHAFQMEHGLLQDGYSVELARSAYQSLYTSVEKHKDMFTALNPPPEDLIWNQEQHCRIELQWTQLQEMVLQANEVADQTAQWVSVFDQLCIEEAIKRLNSSKDDEVPLLEQQEITSDSLIKSLNRSLSDAQYLSSQAPEGSKRRENINHFQQQHDMLYTQVTKAQTMLAQKKKQAQGQIEMDSCQSTVSAMRSTVKKEIELWKKELKETQELSCLSKRNAMETKRQELTRYAHQVIEPILARLKSTHDTQPMRKALSETLDEMDLAIQIETSINDMIQSLLEYAKVAEDITTWTNHCIQSIKDVDPHCKNADQDMTMLIQKMNDFSPVIDSFDEMTSDINQTPTVENERYIWDNLMTIVDQRSKEIKQNWELLEQKQDCALKDIKRIAQILEKAKNVEVLIKDAEDRLEDIKISQHTTNGDDGINYLKLPVDKTSDMFKQLEVEDFTKNISILEQDLKTQINREMTELERMMKGCDDNVLIRQCQKINESAERLTNAIEEKKFELERALDLRRFLTIVDDLEYLQSSFEKSIAQSAPTILMSRGLDRIDLQSKLTELSDHFKYYEENIETKLKAAKEYALSEYQKEKEMVMDYLEVIETRWNLLKKNYKVRKIELGRAVDKESKREQQDCARKSSLPTRKASLPRPVEIARPLPPSPSPSTSTSSMRRPASRFQKASTSVTRAKTRPRLTGPPVNSYAADPRNDLDMEIGRIVNNAPYRVSVKMVPGEVGRYLFGDLNPKLVYCRVLKSKMVMVRVGGGWAELSQFLRDRALLDGDFMPKLDETVEEERSAVQEGFIGTRRTNPLFHSVLQSN